MGPLLTQLALDLVRDTTFTLTDGGYNAINTVGAFLDFTVPAPTTAHSDNDLTVATYQGELLTRVARALKTLRAG